MIEKYKTAIIAGIICGIVLAILSFLSFAADGLLNSGHTNSSAASVISCVGSLTLVVLGAFAFFLSGLLAARLASRHIFHMNDALVLGVITGAVAELIHLPFAMVLGFIQEIMWPNLAQYTGSSSTVSAMLIAGVQLICCFPLTLVVGIILSVLGALAYASVKLKV
jgi:hypothetical protein